MNLRFLIALFFSIIINHTTSSQNNQNQTIELFLQKEYPEDGPGAVILIAKNNNVIFKQAFGLSDIKKRKPLTTDMIFQIGSMTKQFTSAAILQLIASGKVSLEDPIQKYVEYFPVKEYPITIHHLLSQTSGIPEFFDIDEEEMYLLSQEHTPKQLIDYYKNEPLVFEPGTKFQYSNSV